MLPIAALPAAGMLVRFGQPDMLGALGLGQYWSFSTKVAGIMLAAGTAVMDNLPLIFAIGVAIGFAKKSDGSTGLAAAVAYLTYKAVTKTLSPWVLGAPGKLDTTQLQCLHSFPAYGYIDYSLSPGIGICQIPSQALIDYGPLEGIIVGITTALLWQRYYQVKFPSALAFFGGRRFVPIVASGASILLGLLGALIYPGFRYLVTDVIGHWLAQPSNTAIGAFVFGFFQRLLIPLGLHHVLNNVPWFTLGSCTSETGAELHGDLACFMSGQVGSFQPYGYVPGAFMTGLFPIMMGGLLGAAFAIYRCALPSQRKVTLALMLSASAASFITGVTEPIEFSFAFAAPFLLLIHAFLTGTSMAITTALGIRDGFSFSAGAIDYGLSFTRSAQLSDYGYWGPLMLLLLSAIYFVIYYLVFSFCIRFFKLATPGRQASSKDTDEADSGEIDVVGTSGSSRSAGKLGDHPDKPNVSGDTRQA